MTPTLSSSCTCRPTNLWKVSRSLASCATASKSSARKVQDALSTTATESQFFPSNHGLPEDLKEGEFKARYGDVNTPAYNAQVRIIDERIAKIELYK